jgi:hypothetical protein
MSFKKCCVLLGTLFACGLAGCAQDPNEKAVSETISTLQDTAAIVRRISEIVNTEVKTIKNDPKKAMDDTKLADAKKEAEKLKKQAEELKRIKADTDVLRDGLTKEQREALAGKHKAAFQAAASDLGKAERELEAVMLEAEKVAASPNNKKAIEDLREALSNTQKEFAVLTKKQT